MIEKQIFLVFQLDMLVSYTFDFMKLKQALKNLLNENELNMLIRGYDVVGDIAITIIPPELQHLESLIGETILAINKNVRVVAKRDSIYGGQYRTIDLNIIAGENRKETEHKEFGVKLYLNPEKVYFSVRSSNERKRISDLVKAHETILVMFSGVGPYPLILARYNKSCKITGIELNKDAHEFATRNLKVNKAEAQVTFYHGDVRDIVPRLGHTFDRIIMPLPKTAGDYLPLAVHSLKKDGWLHYYDFQAADSFEKSLETVRSCCPSLQRHLKHGEIVVCGHSGPDTYRICIDAHIE